MKNQNSKIYPFALVMMLFIPISKAKGEYSMYLIGESFIWEQDEDVSGRRKKSGYSLWYRSTGKMESIF
ncbi:MAG: hypothetical protein RRA63_05910 [Candidatus Calescibacterium sp.]|nr:hypothetical protein [Candidatus Calescibacterium sp.]